MDNTRTTLTRPLIEGAKPQSKPYRLWDARVPGLFLRVQPSGAKSWNVQWARTTSKSLGRYPVMTLEGARTQALAVLGDAATNGTPAVARTKSKASTLRLFLATEYRPWAKANLKWANGTCDRIEKTFADLVDRPLRDITPWLVEKWRTRRFDTVSASTCNRDIACLRSALNKAAQWGFLPDNPLAAVKSAKIDAIDKARFLSPDEERRMRNALIARDADLRVARVRSNAWRTAQHKATKPGIADDGYGDHLTALVLIAINTGLRRGELTSLTWADVDLVGRRLVVQAGYAKSGKARHIPLNSEAVDVLTHWKQQADDESIVFNLVNPRAAWVGLLKAAKIENFRFHDLRHHFASRLVMAGVDLNTVRELLGHADLKMTLRYAHLAPEHKAEAVERLIAAAPHRNIAASGESL